MGHGKLRELGVPMLGCVWFYLGLGIASGNVACFGAPSYLLTPYPFTYKRRYFNYKAGGLRPPAYLLTPYLMFPLAIPKPR